MLKKVLLYVLSAAAGIVLALGLSAVFVITEVTGSGMEPTLSDGSYVFVSKLSYNDGTCPQTGDIVAFSSDVYGEEGEGKVLVRRVVGSSGDEVEIQDDIFYLNGKPYEEYMTETAHMDDMDKLKISEDEIFVLCDDRKSSMDSRNEAIGVVSMEDCIGKVCFFTEREN